MYTHTNLECIIRHSTSSSSSWSFNYISGSFLTIGLAIDGFHHDYSVIAMTCCLARARTLLQFSSIQSLSHVWLFTTPWIAACQASLFITNSWSPPKPMFIELVMPSNHLILCHPLLLLPSIFPNIGVFSNESALRIRWPKDWSFSLSISPSNEHPGLISFRMDWLDLLAVQGTLKSLLQHQVQKHQFFSAQLSSPSNSHIHTWLLEKP